MRSIRNLALSLTSTVFLAGLIACTGGHGNDNSSGSDKPILVTTQCDAGSSINPTSVRVNSGDRPSFSISLQSGYSIQTIFCNSGGTLIGTQFTMGAVQSADNVHVVTQGRSVGSSIQGEPLTAVKSATQDEPSLRSIHATHMLHKDAFSTSVIVVRIESAPDQSKLSLVAELFGEKVEIPLEASGVSFIHEARFSIGEHVAVPLGERLPSMLRFTIIERETGKDLGAIFIAVQ